jgi:hypothetical protein
MNRPDAPPEAAPLSLRTYRVRTWDTETQEYSAQDGVPEIVRGISGLRRAVRLLRLGGYTAHREGDDSDPSVLIERVDSASHP